MPWAKPRPNDQDSAQPHFITSRQDQAKYLQANTIWSESNREIRFPYYVLGTRKDKKLTDILLVGAWERRINVGGPITGSTYEPQLIYKISVKTKDFNKLEQHTQHILGQPYTANELASEMYDHRTNHFILTPATPGSHYLRGDWEWAPAPR